MEPGGYQGACYYGKVRKSIDVTFYKSYRVYRLNSNINYCAYEIIQLTSHIAI